MLVGSGERAPDQCAANPHAKHVSLKVEDFRELLIPRSRADSASTGGAGGNLGNGDDVLGRNRG